MPVSGVGQLGTGEEKAFGDHGDHQVALSRGLGRDELVHAELADHGQDGLDMAVPASLHNAKGLSSSFAHSGDVPRAARPVFLPRSVGRDVAALRRIHRPRFDHPARLRRSVICAIQVFIWV